MTALEEKVIKWLKARIGDGYVWAGSGYTLTESLLEEKSNSIQLTYQILAESGLVRKCGIAPVL